MSICQTYAIFNHNIIPLIYQKDVVSVTKNSKTNSNSKEADNNKTEAVVSVVKKSDENSNAKFDNSNSQSIWQKFVVLGMIPHDPSAFT